MKTSLKILAAGLMGLAGFVLISAGVFGHGSNLAEAGWMLLALLAFALLARLYRHVVQLHLRLDALFAHIGKLATAAKLASTSRTVEKNGAMLESVQQTQLELDQRLLRLEDAERTASRQAADGQHFVLRSFRELAEKHEQLRTEVREEIVSTQKKLSSKVDSEVATLSKFMRSDKNLRSLAQRAMSRMQYETVQEMEALAQLRRLFDSPEPMPLLGGFAMQPVSMLAVVEEVLRRKPGLMVECGSGTSTLWIAQALARNGKGKLVSLEHMEEYFEKTSRSLQRHGLERWVDLRLAPLREVDVNGQPFQWYAPAAVEDLQDIDILSVDGPPGFIGPLARYPALPLLRDKLSTDALILVDDADREDEQAVMERWKAEIDGTWKGWKIAGRTYALTYRRSPEHPAGL